MNAYRTASGTETVAESKPDGPGNADTACGPQIGDRDDWYRLPMEEVFDALELSASSNMRCGPGRAWK